MDEHVEAVAAKGEQVTISGFAKFASVDRPARMARNPATGAPVKVKASTKAKIIPLKGFKDAAMRASAAPKLAKGAWPPAAKAPAKGGTGPEGPAASASNAAAAKAPAATSATKRPARKVAGAPKTAAAAKTAVNKR
ncbi:MAG: HU family DNA-binding protein [Acidimicrobiales bacterium]